LLLLLNCCWLQNQGSYDYDNYKYGSHGYGKESEYYPPSPSYGYYPPAGPHYAPAYHDGSYDYKVGIAL
jgi:hypothetical protein